VYLLVCDETNLQPSQTVDFFVYGGLAVPADAAGRLSQRIAEIRQAHGFQSTDKLKHQNKAKPPHVAKADWDAAKGEVIAACRDHDVKLIACLIHHKIAANQKDNLIEWQLDTVLDVFNGTLLGQADDVGWVIIDRLGNGKEYDLLKTKFAKGASSKSGFWYPYPRIVGYAATCEVASHLASATDVVIGALGYCINQRRMMAVPKQIFSAISPLIYRPFDLPIWSFGLNLRPIKVQFYGPEYRSLKAHIDLLLAR
jgi:hypothetical protein